jgi:hypothetical protein
MIDGKVALAAQKKEISWERKRIELTEVEHQKEALYFSDDIANPFKAKSPPQAQEKE